MVVCERKKLGVAITLSLRKLSRTHLLRSLCLYYALHRAEIPTDFLRSEIEHLSRLRNENPVQIDSKHQSRPQLLRHRNRQITSVAPNVQHRPLLKVLLLQNGKARVVPHLPFTPTRTVPLWTSLHHSPKAINGIHSICVSTTPWRRTCHNSRTGTPSSPLYYRLHPLRNTILPPSITH